jgi:hypothetical protein
LSIPTKMANFAVAKGALTEFHKGSPNRLSTLQGQDLRRSVFSKH